MNRFEVSASNRLFPVLVDPTSGILDRLQPHVTQRPTVNASPSSSIAVWTIARNVSGNRHRDIRQPAPGGDIEVHRRTPGIAHMDSLGDGTFPSPTSQFGGAARRFLSLVDSRTIESSQKNHPVFDTRTGAVDGCLASMRTSPTCLCRPPPTQLSTKARQHAPA